MIKRYPYEAMETPYEKLKSLPDASGYLQPGVTFAALDTIALTLSDNEAARQMNAAKTQLFNAIFGTGKTGGLKGIKTHTRSCRDRGL